MKNLTLDLRYSLRLLGKQPVFLTAAVLSLAIGIGANTAIFSVVNGILLRPLPGVRNASSLVDVYSTSRHEGSGPLSYPDYQYYRDHNHTLEGLAVFGPFDCYLNATGKSQQLFGLIVSGNYFHVLGARPAQGRFFLPEEDQTPDTHPVAVISYSLWRKALGSDPNAVGRTVVINSHPFTVIGIAQAGFHGQFAGLAPDVWVPAMMLKEASPASSLDRHNVWLNSVGRLKPGVSVSAAAADLRTLAGQLAETYADTSRGRGVDVRTAGTIPAEIRGPVIGFMGILFAIVGLVLLIACSNVGSMMMGRVTGRRKEIAIRLAVGASRWRIVRQVLIETALLFLTAGAIGVLLAVEATRALQSINVSLDVPISLDLSPDWRVLAFTLTLSLAAAVLFGLSPALQASRGGVIAALRNEAATGAYQRSRVRGAFVAAQIALSLVLLVIAGLFLKSLRRAATIDPGFNPDGVQTVRLDIGVLGYDETRGAEFYRTLLERVRSIQGVQAASMATIVPLAGDEVRTGIDIPGIQPPRGENRIEIGFDAVDYDFFKALQMPILRGRGFTPGDLPGSVRVALVNQTMETRYFKGEAVGKLFYNRGRPIQIVGVVKDGKYQTVGEPDRPYYYVPFGQDYSSRATLLVRASDAGASGVAAALMSAVAAGDRNLPPATVVPMTQVMALSLLPLRIAMSVVAALGAVGLLLAALGLFGVVNQGVVQRTREIGTRMSLGAERRDIVRLVVGQGAGLAGIGIAIGIVLALLLSRLLTDLLYRVSPTDPLVYVGVAALLVAVTLLASYIPARRAASVDPLQALRYE